MPLGIRLGPLVLVVSLRRYGLIVDNLQCFIVYQLLEGWMIEVGMGNLTFLCGAQMKDLAPWERHTDGCVGLVANGLQGDSS